VKKILFEDTFMNDEMEASDFLRIGIVRGLYGDYRAKKFYFCVGTSNAGKGVLTDALKVAFGGFVGTFNAKALAYNDKNGSDAAKQLSWVFGIKDKRIAISNEVSMSSSFDGNMIKSLASGGDEFDARKNHIDEVKVINRSTMFCLVNDIPPINPYDTGVDNRNNCIEYKCVFVDGDITKEFERLADKEIKDKFQQDVDYQDALVYLMIDTFKEFKEKGHDKPDIVKEASKEWTADAGSVEGLLKMKYEITRIDDDYVSAREIIDYLTKVKHLKMSDPKIGRELGLLKLVRDDKKINGKTTSIWRGLKILPFFDDECDELN
jgi:phage/plasmid-associated DNA primase